MSDTDRPFELAATLWGISIMVSESEGWDAPRTLDQLDYYLTALRRQGKPAPDRLVLSPCAAVDLEIDCWYQTERVRL